ncbi:MAG: methyl-accepting chemotaxis protein [Legionella sp.]|uniref:methyl-accepting chemotaxis protein n=1 Tax=Legionella sp. TaxID=459 RepID=UPI0039E5FBC9
METVSKPRFFVTLRSRLFLGFMVLSLPLLILIMLLLPRISNIIYVSTKIQVMNLPDILDTQIYQARDTVSNWILTGNPQNKIRFARIWEEITQTKQVWQDALTKLGNPEILGRWEHLWQLYDPVYEGQAKIMNTPRNASTMEMLKKELAEVKPLSDEMIDIIDGAYDKLGTRKEGLYVHIFRQIDQYTSYINHNLTTLRNITYSLLILAVVLTIIVPWLTQRFLASPIDRVIDIAERVAAGERDVNIQIDDEDRLGKMLSSLKSMQAAIKENDEKLRSREEESRQLLEKLVSSSNKFSQYSSKVAAGDLRQRLELDNDDVLYDLGKDLNLMTDGLASITDKITQVSNNIVSMVAKVITAANEKTESINSQASAINEITVSLEEIDKSSKQTMNKAQALREIAKNTYEQGKLGSDSVIQSIHGIKASEEKMKLIAQTILDLSNHTQQIGEITAVVNTLAQQSKMLALNAAIEASKAGEAGKGFAAVATEVRNLAEQSEQSTIQVQAILEDIRRTTEKAVTVSEEGTKSLDSGTQLIEKAGEVIHTLSKMINEAAISSQHIEVAIRQEAVGIEQIVESMSEINRTTTTLSEGLKELINFIHKLDSIAKHLKEDVNIYKI